MRRRTLALLLALLTLCGGCSGPESQEEETQYELWFLSAQYREDSGMLDRELRALPETGENVAEDLVRQLLEGPESGELNTPFPRGTVLRECQVENGLATVDLSETYGGLSAVDLTLADGCIVLTLSQLEEVERVYLTVEGRPRPFRDQVFTREDFLLDNGGGSPGEMTVRLWFLNDWDLGSEERVLELAVGDRPAIAAIQALLAGPEEGELKPVCPPGTTLLSLSVRGHSYTVDLSPQWREEQEDARRLRAMANTLGELDREAQVWFQVEGQPLESYGGLDLTKPLEPDENVRLSE